MVGRLQQRGDEAASFLAAATAAAAERERVDSASADAAGRLRSKVLSTLSCKEAEQLLDGNFRINDEVCTSLRLAWDSAVRLDCQLGEADRPWEERNKWLQELARERAELEQLKAELEAELLCAKLEVQTACASSMGFQALKFAAVLETNCQFRERCATLVQQLEAVVHSARQGLRRLGERPDVRPESEAAGMARRWRMEFDSARDVTAAMLTSLRHPEASVALAASSLEQAIDHNWRFVLELVGLFERVINSGDAGASSFSTDAEVQTEAEHLRDRLEEVLPQLLECKLSVQDAAAKSQPQDTDLARASMLAAQAGQAEAWKFLTTHNIDLSNVVPTKFAEEMLPHPAAFGPAAMRDAISEAAAEGGLYPPVIRALTYNIFLRAPAPQFTHNTDDDRKDERLCRFVEHLARFDLICLQEAFGAFSQRRDWLVSVAKRFGFQDSHRSSTNVRPRFIVDGGLLVLTRLPIVFKSSLTFEPGLHLDRFTAKGALYAKVQCGATGPFLHVCTTHLQSTYSAESLQQSQLVRHQQLMRLVEFLREQTDDVMSVEKGPQRKWPLLLCGTLNFNGRRGPMDGVHSAEYRAVHQLLRDQLGEVRDLLFDVCGSHPVTYADTRLTAGGEVPVERVLTNSSVYNSNTLKRQCLDYMFFFPNQNYTDDGLPSMASAPEPVVPATCQVEKFAVDRAKDVGAPVTQLSDHYGVEASFAVITSPAYASAARPEQRLRGPDHAVLRSASPEAEGNRDRPEQPQTNNGTATEQQQNNNNNNNHSNNNNNNTTTTATNCAEQGGEDEMRDQDGPPKLQPLQEQQQQEQEEPQEQQEQQDHQPQVQQEQQQQPQEKQEEQQQHQPQGQQGQDEQQLSKQSQDRATTSEEVRASSTSTTTATTPTTTTTMTPTPTTTAAATTLTPPTTTTKATTSEEALEHQELKQGRVEAAAVQEVSCEDGAPCEQQQQPHAPSEQEEPHGADGELQQGELQKDVAATDDAQPTTTTATTAAATTTTTTC
ncbi:unnamed protein product [Polarella glacialis]|uniref:sphingomyelin phosphodiesterase n=1 Tax=Polarella glacialis TaxID=89957 RepID=A0A813KCB0_POLGL|nr:unnamed protein product [Polarella glacialis]